jgi:DNA-binding XRE family transcriptional regulator
MAKVVKISKKPSSNSITSIKDLGEHILYQRTKLQLSRQSAADFCGINYKTLENIEKGNDSCHISNVLQVAHMLGLNIKVEER